MTETQFLIVFFGCAVFVGAVTWWMLAQRAREHREFLEANPTRRSVAEADARPRRGAPMPSVTGQHPLLVAGRFTGETVPVPSAVSSWSPDRSEVDSLRVELGQAWAEIDRLRGELEQARATVRALDDEVAVRPPADPIVHRLHSGGAMTGIQIGEEFGLGPDERAEWAAQHRSLVVALSTDDPLDPVFMFREQGVADHTATDTLSS